ncbi:MAG: S8/S53 family peptidase [Spirochaetales bacterium]|nr:S8/S53 family peptidase [Spirochaetales bacterium]
MMKEKVRFEFFVDEKKFFARYMLKQKMKELVKHTYAAKITLHRTLAGIDKLDRFYKGFYSFELDIDEYEKPAAWDLSRELCTLDGVLGGGPLFAFSGKKKDEIIVKPDDLRWNHRNTFFDEAVMKAKQDGRLAENKNTGIRIVQLDTGFTGHEEISHRFNKSYDRNFLERRRRRVALDPVPEYEHLNPGHGTSTAGIIVGRGIRKGDDYNEGLFPRVIFIPYRMTGSVIQIGGGMLSASIRHAVDKAKCDVITLSIGGLPLFFDWEAAVNYAYRKGVIITAAAGNYVDFVVWPARYENVIGVAGTSPDNTPWDGTCKGPEVNISAPAGQLYVARVERKNNKLNYFYEVSKGTSFSSPHIAAAAALWLHYYKKELLDDFYVKAPWRKVDAFRYALYDSATKPPGWKEKYEKNYGVGIVNALGLLNYNPQDKKIKEAITRKKVPEVPVPQSCMSFEKKDYEESLKRMELLYELSNVENDDESPVPETIKNRVTPGTAAYMKERPDFRNNRMIDIKNKKVDRYAACNRLADELKEHLPRCIVKKK